MPVLRPLVVAALAAAAAATPALAAATTTVDRTRSFGAGARTWDVVVPTHRSAAFQVRFEVPHGRRYTLRLRDSTGAFDVELMDSTTYACAAAGATDVCIGAYEPLAAGTYTFEVRKGGATPAGTVRLTASW